MDGRQAREIWERLVSLEARILALEEEDWIEVSGEELLGADIEFESDTEGVEPDLSSPHRDEDEEQ